MKKSFYLFAFIAVLLLIATFSLYKWNNSATMLNLLKTDYQQLEQETEELKNELKSLESELYFLESELKYKAAQLELMISDRDYYKQVMEDLFEVINRNNEYTRRILKNSNSRFSN